MGEKIEDCEFWLLPKFLTDEDTFMEKMKIQAPSLPSRLPAKLVCNAFTEPEFLFGSDLSSPVESVVGSTESDEEDYVGGLTRQLTHSTLEDRFVKPNIQVCCVKPGSQQSSLCVCSGCRGGSPTGPFQGRRPLPPPTWDLLYAAAGEVARMKMNQEVFGFNQNKGLLGVHPFESPVLDFKTHNQFQANQFQLMKQQYQMVVQNQNRARNRGNNAWPSLPQQNRPGGMRAVFLGGGPGAKKESVGTGVFIPRRSGYPAEARKKPACSTALVPAKVVQALNRNLDEPRFISDSDSAMKMMRINAMLQSQQQKINFIRSQPVKNQEIMLPQEWTY